FKKFELLKSRLMLKLAQAELEVDLGMISMARDHLEGKGGAKQTKKAFSDWADASGLRPPKLARVGERLKNALNRLHALQGLQTVGPASSPDRKVRKNEAG